MRTSLTWDESVAYQIRFLKLIKDLLGRVLVDETGRKQTFRTLENLKNCSEKNKQTGKNIN